MTKYLIKQTSKHRTRVHYLSFDGKRPFCDRSKLIPGKNGWEIKDNYTIKRDGICWHCLDKKRSLRQKANNTVEIFVSDKNGNTKKIEDFYWFERNGVHNFYGEGLREQYYFTIYLKGKKVFSTIDILSE